MRPKFIRLRTRSYKIVHGFTADNVELVDSVEQYEWTDKLIAVSRIQSVTEKYVRASYSHDRVVYWEYEGGLASIRGLLGELVAGA